MEYSGRCLIYGGCGALGKALVQYFMKKNWWVVSIDFKANVEAQENILIESSENCDQQCNQILSKLLICTNNNKFDSILCVAGGWVGGNVSTKDFISNSDLMWKQSVWTSLISAHISSTYLKDAGLLVLTGAYAALKPTSGMIGYGIAKAGVHHLIGSLSSSKSGLPKDSCVAAILPKILDTPMNRSFTSAADIPKLTPLEDVSELLYNWSANNNRPVNGSLVSVSTSDGKTTFDIVKNNDKC